MGDREKNASPEMCGKEYAEITGILQPTVTTPCSHNFCDISWP